MQNNTEHEDTQSCVNSEYECEESAFLLPSSDSPFALMPPSPPPPQFEKKNLSVKAIVGGSECGWWFLVKCGGNQLNVELKEWLDVGQISGLLKQRPVPAGDLILRFNYCNSVYLLLSVTPLLCGARSFSPPHVTVCLFPFFRPLLFHFLSLLFTSGARLI